MKALARLAGPEVLPMLHELAKNPDWRVRAREVEMLASFSGPEALPVLRALPARRDERTSTTERGFLLELLLPRTPEF
jgi:HEAT repeat protein